MKKRILGAIALLIVGTLSASAFAQSAPEPATVAFDFQLGKMMNGKFMKSLEVEDQLKSAQESGQLPEDVDPTKIARVFGAMSLPDDLATFQSLGDMDSISTLPFEMFVQIKMTDKESADKFMDEMVGKSKLVEMGGKKYYAPGDGEDAPDNIFMHRLDKMTLEFGTKAYLTQKGRSKLFSEGLSAAWKKVPQTHSLKLAVDLNGEKALVSEAIEMGKAEADDAMAKAYLDLLGMAQDLRFSIDFDSDSLVELGTTGEDSEGTEKLRGGLDAMMGIAKMGGKQFLGMLPDPGLQKVANEVLDSLAAKSDGNNVRVTIPKPSGFNSAIKGMVDQLKMMQGPGSSNDDF